MLNRITGSKRVRRNECKIVAVNVRLIIIYLNQFNRLFMNTNFVTTHSKINDDQITNQWDDITRLNFITIQINDPCHEIREYSSTDDGHHQQRTTNFCVLA